LESEGRRGGERGGAVGDGDGGGRDGGRLGMVAGGGGILDEEDAKEVWISGCPSLQSAYGNRAGPLGLIGWLGVLLLLVGV
jgi:hypothetical protein